MYDVFNRMIQIRTEQVRNELVFIQFPTTIQSYYITSFVFSIKIHLWSFSTDFGDGKIDIQIVN